MSSNFLADASRNRHLLTRISRLLPNLPTDEPLLMEKVAALRDTIDGWLSQLNTACMSLQDLQSREQRGDSAISPQERQALIRRIAEVEVFCTSGLVPALTPLARDLVGRPEAAALEKLIQEAEVLGTVELQAETWRQERSPAGTPAVQVARSEREVSHDDREQPVAVAVSSILLEHLQAHQQRLGEYIQGYIRCQRFSGRVDDARETFERARAQGLKTGDWERVRRFLNEMFGMLNELGPGFRDDSVDFQGPFTAMEGAVREARLLVKKAANLPLLNDSVEPAALVQHLTDMRDALDEIATICPTKAEMTLAELRDIINQIFGEIGRQREARRHATDRAGSRAVKMPMPPPARTVAEKGG